MDRPRAARAVLAAGAAAYAIAVAVASQAPGPRTWALHLPGYLDPSARFLVMALIFGGAILLAVDFVRGGPAADLARGGPAPARDAPRGRSAARAGRSAKPVKRKHASFPGRLGWLLLLPGAWLLFRFVTRTRFLGDGTVWLDGIRSGHPNPFSEPLAAATWKGFAWVLRSLGLPIDPVTAGLLPILCGIVAALVFWGIASELTRRSGSRPVAFAVLATLGIVQLYFGYIESYPMVSVAVLTFLWLGLRRARGADHPLWLALALAVAVPFHLATAFLAPSYLYLVLRDRRPPLHRAALAVLPAAGAAGLLMLLGYAPARWVGAFRIAARAVEPGHGAAAFTKPYAAVSIDHAWDILNAILLVLPVPAMLLMAAAVGKAPGRRSGPRATPAVGAPSADPNRPVAQPPASDAATIFLAAAALPGLLMAAALVLPVPPAQDWDLTSILLLPLAVLGVKAGCSIPRVPLSGTRGLAVAMLGAGALLSFVLVNANEESGRRRFETIVGPGAKITDYGRAYGNELLATYDVSRRDFALALLHAQRALEAEPTNPRYWVKKGAALYELGRFDEAIPVLAEGIRRGPARDDAYYDLGNCYTRLRRYSEAVASYREAVRLSQPRPDYFNNLGVALYHSGDADSARMLWTEVVQRWPWYTLSARSLMERFGPGALDSARISPRRG